MTMPAGTYYVGDLCYVIGDEDWDEVCSVTFEPNTGEAREGEFNLSNKVRFAMFGTAYGDGEYRDQQNRRYLVDSGTIGCVRIKDLVDRNDTGGGNVVEFKHPFEVGAKNGTLTFGDIVINTRDDDWEDQEYDEEVFDDWDRD